MTDVAFNYLSKQKKEIDFAKLWEEVSKTLEVPTAQQPRKKAQFYSELMLDTRFASLKGNKWDLGSRRKYDEVHIGQSLIDDLDDDSDEIEEEEETEEIIKNEEEY